MGKGKKSRRLLLALHSLRCCCSLQVSLYWMPTLVSLEAYMRCVHADSPAASNGAPHFWFFRN